MTPEDSPQNHDKFFNCLLKLEGEAHEMENASKALDSLGQLLKYFPDEGLNCGFAHDLGQLVSILAVGLLEKSKFHSEFLSSNFKDPN